MRFLNDYSDERFKGPCIHCGADVRKADANNDHVPSKCLLQKPYPENLPVVKTCFDCNSGFSKDEEYVSVFLQCVLAGSTDPNDHRDPRVSEALRRSRALQKRIEDSKLSTNADDGPVWFPEQDRVNNIVLKNARGHAFYELGEPQAEVATHTYAAPLHVLDDAQLWEFEKSGSSNFAGWPEVGSRAMERAVLGSNVRDGWITVQDDVYRYKVVLTEGVFVRTVLMEYLATEVYWSEH